MGATIRKKIKFLLCDHQQEEPDELRGSRPVPWEGGGAIPLPDPITSNPFRPLSLTRPLTLNTPIPLFQNQSLKPKPTQPTRRKTKEKQPTHKPTRLLHICFAQPHPSNDD
jgi:hypothetical protein